MSWFSLRTAMHLEKTEQAKLQMLKHTQTHSVPGSQSIHRLHCAAVASATVTTIRGLTPLNARCIRLRSTVNLTFHQESPIQAFSIYITERSREET